MSDAGTAIFNNNISIGNSSVAFPSGEGLQVYSSGNPRIKLANSTTGVASGDGTQFYLDSADVIYDNKDSGNQRWYTGGSERIRLDSSGKVGMGATSPSKNLHIKSGVSEDTGIIIENTNNAQNLDIDYWNNAGAVQGRLRYAEGSGAFSFFPNTSATEALTILYDGKVGIGTESPSYPLSVELDASATWLSRFYNTGTTESDNGLLVRTGSEHDGTITLGAYSGSSYKFVVLGDGNVGIGTTSPSAPLDVVTDSAVWTGEFTQSNTSNGDGVLVSVGSTAAADYALSIRSDAGSTHVLAAKADGKVGIGTASPLSHLTFESDHWNTGTEDSCSIRWNNGITTADSVLQNFEDGNVAPFVLGMNSFVSSGGSFTTFNNSYAASYLYLGSSGAITFGTSSSGTATERMQIKNSGEVLIGTQTAVSNAKLTVDGGDMMVHGANNSCGMSDLLPGYTRGDYGVVHSTANHVYFVVGSSYVSYINGGNGTFNVSDQRLKENVATLTGTLDKVKQLRGVSFTWKDTEERGTDTAIGLIAQEVETVYPELVDDGGLPKDNEGNDPYKSVNYAHLTSVLIEAIKELSAELDSAKSRIATLEGN